MVSIEPVIGTGKGLGSGSRVVYDMAMKAIEPGVEPGDTGSGIWR